MLIVCKARKSAGFLYRRFYKDMKTPALLKLYASMVRPILQYCSSVWDPYLQKDITLLERVQRFALRISLKEWHCSSDVLTQRANLPSLRNRRAYLKLCALFKIINRLFVFQGDIVNFRPLEHIMQTCSRSSQLIHRPFTRANSLFYSFVPHTASLWNGLPPQITNCTSFLSFKRSLKQFMSSLYLLISILYYLTLYFVHTY